MVDSTSRSSHSSPFDDIDIPVGVSCYHLSQTFESHALSQKGHSIHEQEIPSENKNFFEAHVSNYKIPTLITVPMNNRTDFTLR